MHASARHTLVSTALLVLAATSQLNCGEEEHAPLGAPGGGVSAVDLDRPATEDTDGSGGAGGAGGGEESGGGGAGEEDVFVGEGSTEIFVGDCAIEGAKHVCFAYNFAGCAEGVQTCVDATWSICTIWHDDA